MARLDLDEPNFDVFSTFQLDVSDDKLITAGESLTECVVPENIHTPPTEGFWFASPHPFGISVPRGYLMTPSLQEFPRYANMVFVVTVTIITSIFNI